MSLDLARVGSLRRTAMDSERADLDCGDATLTATSSPSEAAPL